MREGRGRSVREGRGRSVMDERSGRRVREVRRGQGTIGGDMTMHGNIYGVE